MEILGKSIFNNKALKISIDNIIISEVTEIEDSNDMPYISPGFFDMQLNGYLGIDYSNPDLSIKDIINLINHIASSGTTFHIPTFVSMPHKQLLSNIKTTMKARKSYQLAESSIPGLHIEGPFISPEMGPRGVHDPKYITKPNFNLFKEWQEAAEGTIKYVTIAPEVNGAIDFIREAVASGIKVSIGHTGALPEEIHKAISAGASLSTHLGNGSNTSLPRLRNYIWEQLASDNLQASIITDGYHLPESVVKVFTRAKGLNRIILVSDAALLGGYDPGVYKWGDMDIEVFEDSHLGLLGTSILAGAAHLLDWDIAHFMSYTGVSLKEAIALCTVQPARFLELDTKPFEDFVPHQIASLVSFTYDSQNNDSLKILQTINNGELLFDSL